MPECDACGAASTSRPTSVVANRDSGRTDKCRSVGVPVCNSVARSARHAAGHRRGVQAKQSAGQHSPCCNTRCARLCGASRRRPVAARASRRRTRRLRPGSPRSQTFSSNGSPQDGAGRAPGSSIWSTSSASISLSTTLMGPARDRMRIDVNAWRLPDTMAGGVGLPLSGLY